MHTRLHTPNRQTIDKIKFSLHAGPSSCGTSDSPEPPAGAGSGRTLLGTPPAHLKPWPTPPQQQSSGAGGVGTPPAAAELWCWGVLASGSSVRLYRQLERIFFAGLRRPVVGKVLHMKWLEGELHGFHHVAARHCGDASHLTVRCRATGVRVFEKRKGSATLMTSVDRFRRASAIRGSSGGPIG